MRRRRNAVNRREFRVHIAIVAGEGLHEVAAIPYQIAEEDLRFLGHGDGGLAAELRIGPAVARGRENPIEAEPLRDELVERLMRARVIAHPFGGLCEAMRR